MHPAPMREIGMAMRLICEHEEEWLVDTDRIAVCGFSAGGHNAAMYATRWHEEPGNPRPAAAILCYPLTDYVYKRESEARRDPMNQMFFRASDRAFLGTEEPGAALLDEVSPARHVTENTPPTFLWATAADSRCSIRSRWRGPCRTRASPLRYISSSRGSMDSAWPIRRALPPGASAMWMRRAGRSRQASGSSSALPCLCRRRAPLR